MIDIAKAPDVGTIYATYLNKVVYQKYDKEIIQSELLNETDLLELHLFDSKEEYRVVKSRVRGLITSLINDQTAEADDYYEEKVYVLPSNVEKLENTEKSSKVGVVNYIRYDENDMLQVINYRLKEVNE